MYFPTHYSIGFTSCCGLQVGVLTLNIKSLLQEIINLLANAEQFLF